MTEKKSVPVSAASLHPFYMLASLCLGSTAEALAAVTEAAASATRQQTDMLPQLLRICQTRCSDKAVSAQVCDFPADSPLRDALRLTYSGRRDLGLLLCGFDAAEAAEARGITADEHSHKTEKALRQFTFLNAGKQPDQQVLRAALESLPWAEPEVIQITAGLQNAAVLHSAQPGTQDRRKVTEITRRAPQKPQKHSVPLWAFLAMTGCVLALTAALIFLYASRQTRVEAPLIDKAEAEKAIAHEYILLDAAQDAARAALPEDAQNPICTNTKLKLDAVPVVYEITILCDRGMQYVVILDAKTAVIQSTDKHQTTEVLHIEGWLSTDLMRTRALQQAGLSDAVFLKEKRGTDNSGSYYKYEMLGADSRVYTVQMDAITGKLLKYSVEEPVSEEVRNVISPQQAQKQALLRVSDVSMNDAIFTKTKLDGMVYMVGFTLDDGTQYTAEINAVSGAVNTMDVRPVSASKAGMIGMLKARDIALEKAGLLGYAGVRMTKAKIDRESSAYVYELEFETEEYEYEVTLHTETGEILKYRAWKL